MTTFKALRLAVLAMTVMLVPVTVSAHVLARSFDDLAGIVKPGQSVLVSDRSGREEPARIVDVTPTSLTVSTKERTRVLTEQDVVRVRRNSGAVKKGAWIGTAAALSVSLLVAATYSGGEGFCGACLAAGAVAGVPLGAAIGAGVGFGVRLARRPTIYLAADTIDAR